MKPLNDNKLQILFLFIFITFVPLTMTLGFDNGPYVILALLVPSYFFMIRKIRKSDALRKYALLLVLGGALGNFFDRLVYKAVPDFIDFHVGNFHWFIFNVSDIFITIGIILMIIIEIINKPEATNNEKI